MVVLGGCGGVGCEVLVVWWCGVCGGGGDVGCVGDV